LYIIHIVIKIKNILFNLYVVLYIKYHNDIGTV